MSFDPRTAYGQGDPAHPPYRQAPQQPARQPVYGQSNPSLPPYGQPLSPQTTYGQMPPRPSGQGAPSLPGYPAYGQPVPPYAAPVSAPAQPYQQGPQSWGAGMPPASPPPAPVKKHGGAKIAIIIVILLLVLGGGGGAFYAYYVAHLPRPVINMTGQYRVGTVLAGATDTKFLLTGHDFSASSTIIFLLDGAPAPGSIPAQSASDGSVTATLTVTAGWSIGSHTVTAKDATGYVTKAGVPIAIVAQGQAGTPGPNGAPTDSASGTIHATIRVGGQSAALDLAVTGSPDGGKVCGSKADGKSHTLSGTENTMSYTETRTLTCSGTYKGGKLSYTETATSDILAFNNGVRCVAKTPYMFAHLEGTFSSATTVSGSFSQDAVSITCSLNGASKTSNSPARTGTWTGNASMQ
jgi:hypothetical protein